MKRQVVAQHQPSYADLCFHFSSVLMMIPVVQASKAGASDEEKNLSVSALLQKRSDAASPVSPLPDIDSKDLDDPLTCADYVGDIFSYYRSVEPRYCVDADYMAKRVSNSQVPALPGYQLHC